MKKSKEFMLKFLVISLIALLGIGLIFSLFWGIVVFYITLFLYVIITLITIFKAWTQVPHKWVYILEKYGEFYQVLEPGLHFVFPWFGFLEVKHKIFTGTIKLPLFDEEVEETGDYKGGIVDLKDESAKIQAFFFFQVSKITKGTWEDQVELYKRAAYETSDPIAYIKAAAEAALRSFLAQYELLQANELKTNFDLNEVANMIGPKKVEEMKQLNVVDPKEAAVQEKKGKNNWKKSRFGIKLLSWGFTPTNFIITEIQFPDRVMVLRSELKKSKNDLDIAHFQQLANIKLSKGEAQALKNMSVARKLEVKDLVNGGMNMQEAITFVTDRRKYEALTKAEKVFFFEGENSNSKKGAEMGAGFGVSSEK